MAVNGHAAASTQNQAFNALLFLYDQVLHQPFENVQAARAPVVLTSEEVRRALAGMAGTPQLVARLLYGSGLRLMEGLRLRVKDIDFDMKQLTVRDGKGGKARWIWLGGSNGSAEGGMRKDTCPDTLEMLRNALWQNG